MDISALTNSTQNTTPLQSQSDAVLTSDFETFLQMLTTQAKYQDPLEPIDSSEYAAQLAQFSMVEQQVKSNQLLEALAAQLGSSAISQMTGWIGMDARSTAPIQFDGDPISVTPKLVEGADESYLTVFDGDGVQVQRQKFTNTGEPVEWTGVAPDGTAFESGIYSFKVESSSLGQVFSTDDAETYSRIVEAKIEGQQTTLVLTGGASVSSEAITALRAPE